MATIAELKQVFRHGWSNEARVENWVNRVTIGEFDNPICRQAWLEALRKAAERGRVRETLDTGTGPGTISQLWAELGFVSTGLDFSPTMITAGRKIAEAKGLPVTFVEGDAETPPFSDESFDLVSSRLMLFTLPNPGYAVRRWVQLLKPGGLLVLIGEESPPDAERRLRENPSQDQQQPDDGKPRWRVDENYRAALNELPFRDHTAGTLRVLMQALGLRDIQLLSTDEVIAARKELKEEGREGRTSTPYIVAGIK
ncbi:MAG: methyltransferase domain-containing protein [Planctomycetes bacterium]|nr:methyltransferase domain-containing protein [Planctomycetota bacterium]